MVRVPRFSPVLVRVLAASLLAIALFVALVASNARAFAAPFGGSGPATSKAEGSAAGAISATAGANDERIAPDSPRASLTDFNRLTRVGDYGRAARYLDLSSVEQSDGPLLAKHLREVLDRHLWIDVEKLSPNSHGNEDDGLGPDREELGNVPGATGKPEPVIMVRRVDRAGARWVFAASSVAHIEDWYSHLENRWLLERLPKWALSFGPHELRWWQWLALAPLLTAGWVLGFVVTRVSRLLIVHVMPKHSAETVRKLRGPATLAWMVGSCYALLPWLGLYEPAGAYVRRWFSALLLVALFWALWKAVELSQHSWGSTHWARSSLTAASLLNLAARLGKFVVAAFAFVAVLAELGYPVTSLITGLGIGGVALALAAQKTVENLFGAFSLAIDQPFREGDVIQLDGISGTVEVIGLRSTRIRTVDRTLISIPNGKLAEMRVETISARDQIRFYCLFGVVHSAASQMTKLLRGIEDALRDAPYAVKDSISVRFVGLSDSALNIEVSAMLATTNYAQFMDVRQSLLLSMLAVIDDAGSALSNPVRSIELGDDARAALAKWQPPPR
ncbi:MAG: mechanosensitive ion channel family protein [Pseudomonadota bacterium]